MEVVVTTGVISHAKLQSNHRHQQTNIQFFYRPDALPVAQPTVSKHWRKKYHIPRTCSPQAHLGIFQLCLWPLIAPGYLEGGLPCLPQGTRKSHCCSFYDLMINNRLINSKGHLLEMILLETAEEFYRSSLEILIPAYQVIWCLTVFSAQTG